MQLPHPLRILILDQDEQFRLELRQHLELASNCLVEECASVRAATNSIAKHSYDVVMVDHETVRSEGIDLYQWMRENKRIVPTVELLSPEDVDAGPHALMRGAYDYVRKDRINEKDLSILLSSVREQYLLRLQWNHAASAPAAVDRRREIVESLEKAAEAVALSVNTSLAVVFAECEEYELSFTKPGNLSKLAQGVSQSHGFNEREAAEAFSRLRREIESLATSVRSLISFSNQLISRISESEKGENLHVSPLQPLAPTREAKKQK